MATKTFSKKLFSYLAVAVLPIVNAMLSIITNVATGFLPTNIECFVKQNILQIWVGLIALNLICIVLTVWQTASQEDLDTNRRDSAQTINFNVLGVYLFTYRSNSSFIRGIANLLKSLFKYSLVLFTSAILFFSGKWLLNNTDLTPTLENPLITLPEITDSFDFFRFSGLRGISSFLAFALFSTVVLLSISVVSNKSRKVIRRPKTRLKNNYLFSKKHANRDKKLESKQIKTQKIARKIYEVRIAYGKKGSENSDWAAAERIINNPAKRFLFTTKVSFERVVATLSTMLGFTEPASLSFLLCFSMFCILLWSIAKLYIGLVELKWSIAYVTVCTYVFLIIASSKNKIKNHRIIAVVQIILERLDVIAILMVATVLLFELHNTAIQQNINFAINDSIPSASRIQSLERLVIQKIDLSGIALKTASLSFINLQRASLAAANFADANLSNANLENANLEGANLENANLEGANLENAKIEESNLVEAELIKSNHMNT